MGRSSHYTLEATTDSGLFECRARLFTLLAIAAACHACGPPPRVMVVSYQPSAFAGSAVTEAPPSPQVPVPIAVGQSIQSMVDAHPPGTTFLITTGIHRLATVKPKPGNTFVGEPRAVLSGARLLTTFARDGPYWVATDQLQQGPITTFGSAPKCAASHPRCNRPEDLFIDDRPLRHVPELRLVAPGSWYFDYVNHRIYFADDPHGHTVETSVATHAFHGSGAPKVTIRGLTIEKYANPGQMGAVYADGAVEWTIEHNEVRLNHGAGISLTVSASSRITSNHVHHNGQLGIGAWNSERLLVEANEINHNNFAGFDTSWEAGGTKFSWSRDLIARNNLVHHNQGKGLWTDGDNLNTLYEGNTTAHNSNHGIFHEISYAAIIRNNISRWNGWHGIVVASSPNVEIYGNTVGDNGRTQIFGRQDFLGQMGRYGVRELSNLYVHDNTITAPANDGGAAGLLPQNAAAGDATYYTRKNNRFVHNTYDLRNATASPFVWMFRTIAPSQWQAHDQDVTGTFLR
jgi:parallel beta-helix repeat protein